MKDNIQAKRDELEQELRKGKMLLQQQQQVVEGTRNRLIGLVASIKTLDGLLTGEEVSPANGQSNEALPITPIRKTP